MRAATWAIVAFALAPFANSQVTLPANPANAKPPASSSPVSASPGGIQNFTRVISVLGGDIANLEVVKGLPYEATGRLLLEQTLADGTRISDNYDLSYRRDADGRRRLELPMKALGSGTQSCMVMVRDPVNETLIDWSEGSTSHSAILMHMPNLRLPQAQSASTSTGHVIGMFTSSPPPSPPNQNRTGSAQPATAPVRIPQPPKQNVRTETLPQDTIAGVYVEGKRTTETIPVGSQGNDREIVVVTETWTSPDLKIVVRQVTDDPRTGKTTLELTDVNRSDPDPALFKPPEGYMIVDHSIPAGNPPSSPGQP